MSNEASSAILRPARLPDCPAILRLQNGLFPDDPNGLDGEGMAALVGKGKPTLFVAELSGEIVGFMLLNNRAMRPWTGIDFVGVASHASGLGIGRQLTRFSLQHASRPVARLFVRPSNAAARALYKRLGFRQTGIRQASYSDGEDALVMMKWLGLRAFRRPVDH